MKSGLRDRNNLDADELQGRIVAAEVSMKSGLRDRNNLATAYVSLVIDAVSMKSGLRDRNNRRWVLRPGDCGSGSQ